MFISWSKLHAIIITGPGVIDNFYLLEIWLDI